MKRGLIFVLMLTGCVACPIAASRPTPDGPQGFILGPDEGDRVLSHLIKVDPARGSQRLGIGTQQLKAGRGIALHIHDGEDEVLFVVSGHGVGVVGNVEREVVAGSVIYVPQGAWHGIKAIEPIHVMWIVSPPNFARFNREWLSAGGSRLADARREEIARKHQQSDSGAFLRLVLADSVWQGEEPWGRVAFRSDGLVATYQSPSGLQGALEIRDERAEDLGFIGVWKAGSGVAGEFILTYDFASGAAIHLKWGESFGQHATLRRIE